MAKPDDRSDNPERIENAIAHTLDNINETRDFMKAHGDELSADDKQHLEEKNDRRAASIDSLRNELKDEVHDQRNQ